MVSPLEGLDGGIHALTCIGPASKEMSRRYWREPLVLEVLHEEEVDLCGVIFVGSPQINAETVSYTHLQREYTRSMCRRCILISCALPGIKVFLDRREPEDVYKRQLLWSH